MTVSPFLDPSGMSGGSKVDADFLAPEVASFKGAAGQSSIEAGRTPQRQPATRSPHLVALDHGRRDHGRSAQPRAV